MTRAKDEMQFWPIEKVRPHPDNSKKHPPEQIDLLARLIVDPKKGYFSPILVQKSTGYIIAGHGRRLAAIQAKLHTVPVIVKDFDDAEAAALRLADNRSVSSDYDTAMLQKQMMELNDLGFELGDLGFSDKETSFMTIDLAALDETALVDDISIAVGEQKIDNDRKMEEIDGAKTPVGEAFGFRKITVAQSRRVKSFMTQIESETGKTGIEALMAYFDVLEVA